MLEGYPSPLVDYLTLGFVEGFKLEFEGERVSFQSENLLSARDNPQVVETKLQKELEAHRLAGPFQSPPFSTFRVSPLGVVPKKTPGDFRMIHHLSFPKGSSVNDGISPENSSVSYSTIQDAISYIKAVGQHCFLAKTDIKNAFRIIPVHPDDYPMLGICWKGLYYYDRAMPMGCSSSCKIFETFSTAVEWVARHKCGIPYILHLLDDFLIVAPTESLCRKQLDIFISICGYLGIPIALDKTFGPLQVLSFAGIELDSNLMEARLPADKVSKCLEFLSNFQRRKKVSLKEIQSLIGLLNFACSVIVPGRAFLRRLIDLTIGIRAQHYSIRLTSSVKEDLKVWSTFFTEFNNKSFFLDEKWSTSHKLSLYTDAAGALGFGAIFDNSWCYGTWPIEWTSFNIAILEFYPIILSLYLWGEELQNKSILFFTDNEALVHVINKQSCREKTLMSFVRKMVSVCLKRNIMFRAKHIPGVKNTMADALSRLQVSTFRDLAPATMDPSPTDIPQHLLPQNWVI